MALLGGYLAVAFLPAGSSRFDGAVLEALHLARWYAREHVLLCLVPAFFIAGAISVFVSHAAVLTYLGPHANRWLAYSVASVSGTILAVCSCTVLPLFGGIYQRGAGLGPASAFLYSGPAINVLAIVLTARVLGLEIGLARAVGAIVFGIVIGLLMHAIFRRDDEAKAASLSSVPPPPPGRPIGQDGLFLASLVGILVFANWSAPAGATGFGWLVFSVRWWLTAALGIGLAAALVRWLHLPARKVTIGVAVTALSALAAPGQPLVPFSVGFVALAAVTSADAGDGGAWFSAAWESAKQILPLLLAGVLVAGALLGRPGHEGLIPADWVSEAVGGNSLGANLAAAVAGAFMYFATLTEVPIVQGLMASGMGKGPALALLLAGPALSLPSMLVLRRLMGLAKTVVYVTLVILMATITGVVFGSLR